MELTLAEIAGLVDAPIPTERDARATGYSIDTRTLRKGDLFFAIRGTQVDGREFVGKAMDAGAAGVVVASDRAAYQPEGLPASARSRAIAVPDPLAALQQLSARVREKWGGRLVAITGSTGKTTTKQILTALLGRRFRVLSNEGNLNNHLGLPLSLMRLEKDTEVGVFELGMSAPGEIALLARIAKPDVGIVTNVGAAHLQFFPNVDAIADAKSELVQALTKDNWAVLNADDARVANFGKRTAAQCAYFGMKYPAQFRAEDVTASPKGGYSFRLMSASFQSVPFGALGHSSSSKTGVSEIRFHSPLLGKHNVLNTTAALATCYLFGIHPSELTEKVEELRPGQWRGETVHLSNGALVVNDCYNSNPEALKAMLASVAEIPAKRRIAVLGGMMELGASSEELHMRCGRHAAELGYAHLLTIGEPARAIADGARRAGLPPQAMIHFGSPAEAGAWLRDSLRAGDVALIKASRSVHLEKVWDELGRLAEGGAASPSQEMARHK